MGRLTEVTCKKCGGDWQLQLGYGIGKVDAVVSLFPEPMRQKFPTDRMRSFEEPWEFAMEPAMCPACHAPVSVPVLRLPDSGKVHVGVCPTCGGAVALVTLELIPEMPCPVCGQTALAVRDVGWWD